MTILESAFEQVADTVAPDKEAYHEYDIKIEIVLEEGTKTVHGKSTISKTLLAVEKAVKFDGNTIDFSDIYNTTIKPDRECLFCQVCCVCCWSFLRNLIFATLEI